MIDIGIIGGAGYTAGELIRLLLNHPEANIVWIHSTSNAGKPIVSVHEGLMGDTELHFTGELDLNSIDLLFSCSAHGDTKRFMDTHTLPADLKVIDFTADYRLNAEDNPFIYGLPELNRRATCKSQFVANPGCFATAIQLALLPMAKYQMLKGNISINAITGSTGAGVKPGATTHFSWRTDNISIYKPFEHQHIPEVRQSLTQLQPDFDAELDFIPYRGNFARGIFCTTVLRTEYDEDTLYDMYEQYYDKDSFVFVRRENIDLKQVVNTNKCLLHLEKHGNRLLIISVIDNLLKGAAGTAVHNLNLLFNLEEKVGLNLKPSAF